MSQRFQIVSDAILEAYASLNSTSGPIWARFRAQNPSQNRVQNWSKIDLEGYPRPKPPPKAVLEASRTSPSPFSRSPRSRFFVFSSQTKKVLELLASYCGRHHVDYRVGSHYHRTRSSLRSSFRMFPLRQSILESQIPVLSFCSTFCERFLFGWVLRIHLR